MDFRNYIPPDGGHVGCGIWQSRSLIRDSGSKSNKWTKERLCGGEYVCTESAFFVNKLLACAINYKIVLIMNLIKICIIYHLREARFHEDY